ncbi:hypothetical protein PPERSA_10818 [Pseudocohnilembus persalinus]|uniref:Uncharacterized protein n=1 Tax=Pseudocohnilembus persalinus TaxID=266149 RepID=A0A0V0QDN3_PSEPJ|nr:hypothetical protein PPERSA_10818 [Pseudocohnilembus persalinus]|eukprot:KRX00319.1 hypothetical protein PPERSA_10818 [Pseudocohnilembus persalinus]
MLDGFDKIQNNKQNFQTLMQKQNDSYKAEDSVFLEGDKSNSVNQDISQQVKKIKDMETNFSKQRRQKKENKYINNFTLNKKFKQNYIKDVGQLNFDERKQQYLDYRKDLQQ